MSDDINELKSLIDLAANDNKVNITRIKEKLGKELKTIMEDENK